MRDDATTRIETQRLVAAPPGDMSALRASLGILDRTVRRGYPHG